MTSSIEFHDSTISGIVHDGESARIAVDAYVHRWELVIGSWKGTGWVQPIQIIVVGAAKTVVPDLPAEVYGGSIRTGQVTHENMVPLPFASGGPATLRFELVTGEVLEIDGRQVLIEPTGDGRYVEDLPDEFRLGAG